MAKTTVKIFAGLVNAVLTTKSFIMKKIKIKNFDALNSVMQEMATNLTSDGYHGGHLEIHGRKTTLDSITEWWAEFYSDVIRGGSFMIASVIEDENGDNYYYAGEELWIESTLLNSRNLLIEIFVMEISTDSYGFTTADQYNLKKVYLLEVQNVDPRSEDLRFACNQKIQLLRRTGFEGRTIEWWSNYLEVLNVAGLKISKEDILWGCNNFPYQITIVVKAKTEDTITLQHPGFADGEECSCATDESREHYFMIQTGMLDDFLTYIQGCDFFQEFLFVDYES